MYKVVIIVGLITLALVGFVETGLSETSTKKDIGVYNDWGKLKEVLIGIEDETIEPEWLPALAFLSKEAQVDCKKYGGKKTADVFPEIVKQLRSEIEGLVNVLKDRGVIVHRTEPMRYKEERAYLDNVQKGNHSFGGEDYFRVIGDNVILINSLRLPFRRKHVYYVRPALEPLLEGSNAKYVAMPPPSPHYDENDAFLEAGDILMDGFNIYVGLSGKGSSTKGIVWLQQYLGPEYKAWTVNVDPGILHLDCVMTLIKPGLLVYYPDLVGDLPEPLKGWEKIALYKKEGEEEPFGANNLSLDENTIIVADRYPKLVQELKKRGMEVIVLPFDMTIAYGAGPRCLTAVLRRDH